MKKEKQTLIKLVLMMCFTLVVAVPLAVNCCRAATEAVVTGDVVTAVHGESIEYKVSISGNPGIASYNLRLRFDTEVLALEYDEATPETPLCVPGDFSDEGNLICASTDYGCQVLWTNTGNVSSDGVLFSLSLRVLDGATPGEYAIKLENISKNTINKDEERVPLRCCSGSVTVRLFSPLIYCSNIEVRQGDSFDFTVYMQDNPSIASCNIRVLFDEEHFSLVDDNSSPAVENSDEVFCDGNFIYRLSEGVVEVFWSNSQNVSGDGALFTLRFKTAEDTPVGEYPVELQCVVDNTLNVDEEQVSFSSESTAVKVLSSVETTILFHSTNSVSIEFSGGKGKYIIAALYDGNGRMIASSMKCNTAADTIILSSPAGLSGAECKLMVLDASFVPLQAPITAIIE